MKNKLVIYALSLLIIAGGGVLYAQQQPAQTAEQSLEEAFLGANPDKTVEKPATVTIPATEVVGAPTTAQQAAPSQPSQEKTIINEAQRIEKLMGVGMAKSVKGMETLKSHSRPFVVAAYNTKAQVVMKASRIAWEKISSVVTSSDSMPEIIITAPNNIFEVNGSSYILLETEQGMALTFVSNSRKMTVLIGITEGAFITSDGYVCRVKRYEG